MRPQIFVQSLGSFLAGNIDGEWLDAAQDAADLWSEVEQILAAHEDEEYIILDINDFGGIDIDGYEDIGKVSQIALALEEHGKPFAVFYQHFQRETVDETLTDYEDLYFGSYTSEAEFVEEYLDNFTCSEVMNAPLMYGKVRDFIDISRVKNVLDSEYFIEEQNGEVYVFVS